ncbi:hypothetical protein IC229_28520 [Spirosoma sp. BT702]|uniref:Uncharacterized protein n=1 Tax=Spirosoma profusum TaxID=2771354 RepID=A0A926Y5I6_9BACT|nr:hypothetical protein [Spirosoma profusum]MBD2704616.1 hypothetical protein [Spirosoma profusum]
MLYFNASYLKGTACHLDLIQWATDPVWGKIKDVSVRTKLKTADADFLQQQLKTSLLHLLLLNGKSVIETVLKTYNLTFHYHSKMLATKSAHTKLLIGIGSHGIPVIGWTINSQSSFGVSNELRQMIAEEVSILYQQV